MALKMTVRMGKERLRDRLSVHTSEFCAQPNKLKIFQKFKLIDMFN